MNIYILIIHLIKGIKGKMQIFKFEKLKPFDHICLINDLPVNA